MTLTSVPKVNFSGFHYTICLVLALNFVYRNTSSSIGNNSFSLTNILLQTTEECYPSYGKEENKHTRAAHVFQVKNPA